MQLERLNITIPVLIDSPQRRRNLDVLLLYLKERQLLQATVVIEQHTGVPQCDKVPCTYLQRESNDGLIHRIEMLNTAFKARPARVLFLWDVDAVFEPYAVDLAINQVFYRKWDMVLPFNGYALKAEPENYTKGSLFTHLKDRSKPFQLDSVGFGAVMNWDAWWEAGTENENMISYGPDDWERWWRWKNLNMKVQKYPGPDSPCIHMNHPNSIYSRTAHSMSNHNITEYEKIKRMSREALLEYIKTWPWAKGKPV